MDDDSGSASGSGYTIAEIVAAVTAADAIQVDSGTGFPTYRFLKNLVVGGASSNASHIVDTNCVLTFDATRVLKTRTTNVTNIGITFGTRIGSGNTGSGGNGVIVCIAPTTGPAAVNMRGTIKMYGSRICKKYVAQSQQLQFTNLNAGSELVNCQLDGFTGYVLGSSGANLGLAYNVDITQPSVASTTVITSFFIDVADRLTVSSTLTNHTFPAVASNTAGVSFRDTVFFGDFTVGCLQPGSAATNWNVVQPQWPSGQNLFGANSVLLADNGAHEYWLFDPIVVDGSTGAVLSGIPVRLTDGLGNVVIDTTTGSDGKITYGSGLTANRVIVRDHYNNTYRSRSPFTCQINQTGTTNPAYPDVTYNFYWPGDDTGRYTEVGDIMPLGNPAGGAATVWVEQTL